MHTRQTDIGILPQEGPLFLSSLSPSWLGYMYPFTPKSGAPTISCSQSDHMTHTLTLLYPPALPGAPLTLMLCIHIGHKWIYGMSAINFIMSKCSSLLIITYRKTTKFYQITFTITLFSAKGWQFLAVPHKEWAHVSQRPAPATRTTMAPYATLYFGRS